MILPVYCTLEFQIVKINQMVKQMGVLLLGQRVNTQKSFPGPADGSWGEGLTRDGQLLSSGRVFFILG